MQFNDLINDLIENKELKKPQESHQIIIAKCRICGSVTARFLHLESECFNIKLTCNDCQRIIESSR